LQFLRLAVPAPVLTGAVANFSVWPLMLVGPAVAAQPVVSLVVEEQVVFVVAAQPWSAAEELVLLAAAVERTWSVAVQEVSSAAGRDSVAPVTRPRPGEQELPGQLVCLGQWAGWRQERRAGPY